MSKKGLKLNQPRVIKMLSATILLSTFAYAYMINVIAFDTASRQTVAESVSIARSEISELESQLMREGRKNNKELAVEFGLVKSVVNEAIVIIRDNSTRLTLNE